MVKVFCVKLPPAVTSFVLMLLNPGSMFTLWRLQVIALAPTWTVTQLRNIYDIIVGVLSLKIIGVFSSKRVRNQRGKRGLRNLNLTHLIYLTRTILAGNKCLFNDHRFYELLQSDETFDKSIDHISLVINNLTVHYLRLIF